MASINRHGQVTDVHQPDTMPAAVDEQGNEIVEAPADEQAAEPETPAPAKRASRTRKTTDAAAE